MNVPLVFVQLGRRVVEKTKEENGKSWFSLAASERKILIKTNFSLISLYAKVLPPPPSEIECMQQKELRDEIAKSFLPLALCPLRRFLL
jgi:hypothetical protein